MYRSPAEREKEAAPPKELVYRATDESGGSSLALFQYFGLPLVAAAGLAALAGSTAGLVGLVGGGAYSFWSFKNRKNAGSAVLKVENEVLLVEVRGNKPIHERFRLGDLANVSLDVKTIERVTEGDSAIPAMRFIDAKVGPKVDTARIVLTGSNGREVRLTEEYLAHMHAVEWMGKIRSFLRKHGWVPEDERESPPSSQ